MEPSWTSEIYLSQLKNDSVQAFDTKWDEVASAVTDRLTDSILETLYKMQVEKSEGLKYLGQVFSQEATSGDKKCDYCRLKLMAQRHLVQKIRNSHSRAGIRHEDRPAIGAPSKWNAKGQDK